MTSLLSSIFGDDKDDTKASSSKKKSTASKSGTAADLFANPTVVPPRPQVRFHQRGKRKHASAREEESMDVKDTQIQAEVQPEMATPDDEAAGEHETNHKHDDDDDDKTIFVGNLPLGTNRKDLERLFRKCGPIRSTRIRSVATVADQGVKLPPHLAGQQGLVQQVLVNQNKVSTDTKASVQGYVVFQDESSVEQALLLNNTIVPGGDHEQRRMRVDRVHKEYDARRSVFCGNMPYHADEESLRACFVQHCPEWVDEDILGVRIVRDKQTHQAKGFGYLLCKDTSMVATALRTMEGVPYLGRPLRVRVCGKRWKTRGGEPQANNSSKKKPKAEVAAADNKPVAVALKQMVVTQQQQQERQEKLNKRKRGSKKTHSSTGKSKRAAAEAKTNKRIKKIEKRLRTGMGKLRKK